MSSAFQTTISNWFKNLSFGGIIGAVTYKLGGWDLLLQSLLWVIALNMISGIYAAAKGLNGLKVSSSILGEGIFKKAFILLIISMGVVLDSVFKVNIIRNFLCYWYMGKEGISFIENLGKANIPFPESIKNVLQVFVDMKLPIPIIPEDEKKNG